MPLLAMMPWRKISLFDVITKLVVSHLRYRMTSQMAVPTRRMRASTPSTLRGFVPSSVFVSTMMPSTMLPRSDHAGSAKYHQWGCMSRAMVSLAFRFFFGNGMSATVVTARRLQRDNDRRPTDGSAGRLVGRIVSP